MRRKRFKHYIDTFIDIFAGMRTFGNLPEFASLGSGSVKVDILHRQCLRDGTLLDPVPQSFQYMFEWFHRDLANNSIPEAEISVAEFDVDLVIGKLFQDTSSYGSNLEMAAKGSARLVSGADTYEKNFDFPMRIW